MHVYFNEAGKIEANFELHFSKAALDTYKYFNCEVFDNSLVLPDYFLDTIDIISKAHLQPYTHNLVKLDREFRHVAKNNKVLLACSGGLDSVFQAINLKQKGYDVILFHVCNINYYSNGKEFQAVKELAKRMTLPLITCNFKANTKTTNKYRKFWAENSFKDMLFYCLMLDYCAENGIYNISSGDDLSLDIEKAVVGTNLSDARQITEIFMKEMHTYQDFEFIPTPQEHKGKRLKVLAENNLSDTFYSCVNPGRFNQVNHNRVATRFDVDLYTYNCGLCRKCAFHNLLRHYYLGEEFTPAFIEYSWNKIANGADRVFFDPALPLETRIQNLYEY